MDNVKIKKHSYLLNVPENIWDYVKTEAEKDSRTVASYINHLLFEKYEAYQMSLMYPAAGLFASDREEVQPLPADSAGVDFEKKVGDIVKSIEEGRGVIRDIDFDKKTFSVHFFEDDFISDDVCTWFYFKDFNSENFLLNWYEKSHE